MHAEPELADLQAALVELLASDVPVEAIAARLMEHVSDDDLARWIASFEAPMLATARELILRWGRRDPGAE